MKKVIFYINFWIRRVVKLSVKKVKRLIIWNGLSTYPFYFFVLFYFLTDRWGVCSSSLLLRLRYYASEEMFVCVVLHGLPPFFSASQQRCSGRSGARCAAGDMYTLYIEIIICSRSEPDMTGRHVLFDTIYVRVLLQEAAMWCWSAVCLARKYATQPRQEAR